MPARSSSTSTNAAPDSSTSPYQARGVRTGHMSRSVVKNRTSRWYIRSTVLVNTAASSSAGSFTTRLGGQPSPSSRAR
ncbi:MAG: hypothetical protein ACO26C_05385 [Ilumatobacteraceae bacterium]